MSIPNQENLSTLKIWTSTQQHGVRALTLPVTSTGQQPSGTTPFSGQMEDTDVPVSQLLGVVREYDVGQGLVLDIFGGISPGAPVSNGNPPGPAGTEADISAAIPGAASTGKQPSGTTPFSVAPWIPADGEAGVPVSELIDVGLSHNPGINT